MDITKVCRRCGQETPFDELVKHKQCTHGVDALCKSCNRAHVRKWYRENWGRAQESVKRYQERHKDRVRQYKDRWKQRNHEQVKEQSRLYRRKNRERFNAYSRWLRQTHPEKIKEYISRWMSNPENREKKRVDIRNRRARINTAKGSHTPADVKRQYDLQNGLCYWCSKPLVESDPIDHVIPLVRGGTNYPDNIVCACLFCNSSKSGRIPYLEWQPVNPLFPRDTE